MKIKIEVLSEEDGEIQEEKFKLEELLSLLATNPETPSPLLSAISKKKSTKLLCQVASNPHSDLSILEELSGAQHEIVRACVAEHPKAFSLMWKLIDDQSPLVRYALAGNLDLPEHIFRLLERDEDTRVARRAKRSLRRIQSENSVVDRIFSMFKSVRKAS